MFYILVRYKDKFGKYPVKYIDGHYIVSEKRFHDHDNTGSLVTPVKAGEVVSQLAEGENIRSIELHTA